MVRPSATLLACLVVACGADPSPAGPEAGPHRAPAGDPSPEEYRYLVRIDDGLGQLEATVCGVPGSCSSYRVDLDRAAERSRWGGRVGEGTLLLSSPAWLRPPPSAGATARALLRFELPEGVEAAVPWPHEDGAHRVVPRDFRYIAHTAFGRMVTRDVEVPGGVLRVSRLPGELAIDEGEIDRYVQSAAGAAATMFGRFPSPGAQVLVVPVGPGADPVAFGHVGRGGRGSVMLLVREDARLDELERDWVAVHELTHLAMPFVRRDDAWLSEGLATYYQELLRARAGLLSEREAFAHIDDGLRRGRRDGTGQPLALESREMHRTRAYRRVYWGGAAFALELDVELRRRGLGSLDRLMERLARCCAEAPRPLGADDILGRFAEWVGDPIVRELSRKHLEAERLPELDGLHAWLGIRRGPQGELILDDRAPGVAVRRALVTAP